MIQWPTLSSAGVITCGIIWPSTRTSGPVKSGQGVGTEKVSTSVSNGEVTVISSRFGVACNFKPHRLRSHKLLRDVGEFAPLHSVPQ